MIVFAHAVEKNSQSTISRLLDAVRDSVEKI